MLHARSWVGKVLLVRRDGACGGGCSSGHRGHCTSGVALEAMYKLRERVVKAKSFAELDIPA